MRTSKINPVWAMVPLLVLAAMIGFAMVDSEDVTDVDGGTTNCTTCGGSGSVSCPNSLCDGGTLYSPSTGKSMGTCGRCGGSGSIDCSTCGGTGKIETHTHSYRLSSTKSYTCGAVYTYTCSCGDSYTDGEGYSSHSWSSNGGYWSGCDYYTERVCTRCGDTTDSYSYTSHSWGSWTTTRSATCTSSGTQVRTCSDCGDTDTNTISATGHSYTSYSAKSATCTTSGNQAYYYCSKCGTYFNSSKTATTWSSLSISALGHSYSASTYAWSSDCSTCTVGFVCSRDSSHTGTATVSSTSTTSGNATTYTVSGTDPTYDASYSQSKTVYTHTATLEYDAEGGSGAPSAQTASVTSESPSASGSHSFTVASDEPTLSGYIFQGWATSGGASSASCQPGGSVSVPYGSTVTLYAVWKAASLEITSEPSTKTLKVGQEWTYTPTTNIAGCTLTVTGADWLSVSDGTVSGTPDSYGTYDITIAVSKDGGYAGTQQTFSLKVYSVLVFTSAPTAEGVSAYAS